MMNEKTQLKLADSSCIFDKFTCFSIDPSVNLCACQKKPSEINTGFTELSDEVREYALSSFRNK